MYFSRIALAADEVLPEAVLAAWDRPAPPLSGSAGGESLAGVMTSITVLPVGIPSLSTLVFGVTPPGSSCSESRRAAAASSSGDPAVVGGIGVGLLTAGLVSITTRNSSG